MIEVFISTSAPSQAEAVSEINIALEGKGYDERVAESDFISESDDTDAAFAGESLYTFAISIDDGMESVREAFKGTPISIEPVQ